MQNHYICFPGELPKEEVIQVNKGENKGFFYLTRLPDKSWVVDRFLPCKRERINTDAHAFAWIITYMMMEEE